MKISNPRILPITPQKKNTFLFAIFTWQDYFIKTDFIYVLLQVDENDISRYSLSMHIVSTRNYYHANT